MSWSGLPNSWIRREKEDGDDVPSRVRTESDGDSGCCAAWSEPAATEISGGATLHSRRGNAWRGGGSLRNACHTRVECPDETNNPVLNELSGEGRPSRPIVGRRGRG